MVTNRLHRLGAGLKVVSQVDGHITGFTQTDISLDYLSRAGQYSWFIGKKRDEDHYEFSKKNILVFFVRANV